MNSTLEEMRSDLLKLRRLVPINSHRAKGLVRRIDKAIGMLMRYGHGAAQPDMRIGRL